MPEFARLLSPGRIGPLELSNRILHAPMAIGLGNRDGSMRQRVVDYLEARAAGGAALVSAEGANVSMLGSGHRAALALHDDSMIAGFARAAEAVHRHGAKFAVQIQFNGRQGRQAVSFRQPVGASPVPCMVPSPPAYPRELTVAEIEDLIELHVQAARRAARAGADAIWIHGAHSYFIGSFLSPLTNLRTDEFGGTLRRRAELALRIIRQVRDAVPDGVALLYRLNACDYRPGGVDVDMAAEFAEMLTNEPVDLIDVTGGSYEARHKTFQGPADPPGGFVENALRIKQAVGDRIPVSVVQKLSDPVVGESALARGLDFVSIARGFHAEPEYVSKLRAGRADDITPCIACLACLDLYGLPGQAAKCTTNPDAADERRRRIALAPVRRRILVAGGGVAGMEAAVRARRAGHDVELHERADRLGGQVLLAARTAPDYAKFADHLARQVDALGVRVHLGSPVDPDAVREAAPDVVVSATGAKPGPWLWDIDDSVPRADLFGAYRMPVDVDARIAVIGADWRGCMTALELVGRGARVWLIEPSLDLASDAPPATTRARVIDRVRGEEAITVLLETTVEMVADGVLSLQSRGEYDTLGGITRIVTSEVVAANDLAEALAVLYPELPVYQIGDADRPRDMVSATQGAADAIELIGLTPSLTDARSRVEGTV
jgi:2,4-dienoyl-CoA reductase-like NADH-dependent reductase (Old Yellow Enzyme family)